jgi:hypothetical protein
MTKLTAAVFLSTMLIITSYYLAQIVVGAL